MNKGFTMTPKVKVTFVLPMALQKDLKCTVINDGYDMKGKSKWVAEAIIDLLLTENFPEFVKINDQMKGFEKLESIVITRELKSQLDNAVITVRRVFPELDGVQSRIVRAAIMQRLLRM
jgi:hypothetical protein